MNDGHKTTNEYCKEVITLVKDLLARQNIHCIEMNQLIHEDKLLLMAGYENLKQKARTSKHADLLCAVHCLCCTEYEFYKKVRKDSVNNLRLDASADRSLGVTSNKPDIHPIAFQSQND